MKLIVCAVYDGAVKAYLQPIFSRSKAEAIRSFADAVGAENSQFRKHAADFHLALLAEYDDGLGSFVCVNPERLVTAMECLPDDDLFPPSRKIS